MLIGTSSRKVALPPLAWPGLRHSNNDRWRSCLFSVVVAAALLLLLLGLPLAYTKTAPRLLHLGWAELSPALGQDSSAAALKHNASDTRLHLIIPASHRDVNLCKLLLGAAVLGYPTSTLAAFEGSFDQPGILGGGSHVAKVNKVLEYLAALPSESQDDLVLMLDAYDIQLQLPASTLIQRYYDTRDAAQQRLRAALGDQVVSRNQLQQTIMFGAGKRCAPNQPHTVACYPLPESPLPADLYGPNTDSVIGHNHWWSNRQRYLNSGYILGPAGAMKRTFEEAWHRIQEHPELDPNDDGSHGSDLMYHGSDQSIFAAMYGRQEWTREKLRVIAGGPRTRPRSGSIMGTHIDNVLDPSVTHEDFRPDTSIADWWRRFEYGMYLDFWSDVGHQTINSEEDGKWITWSLPQQPLDQVQPRHRLDCPVHVPDQVPADITDANSPTDRYLLTRWSERPLYTHVCMSRIPVLVHMNGIKEHREEHWPRLWYQPRARQLLEDLTRERHNTLPSESLEAHQARPQLSGPIGTWTDSGRFLTWAELCPAELDGELFRDQ